VKGVNMREPPAYKKRQPLFKVTVLVRANIQPLPGHPDGVRLK
jgi:hypothetical protein